MIATIMITIMDIKTGTITTTTATAIITITIDSTTMIAKVRAIGISIITMLSVSDREGRYWHREWEPEIHEGFVFTPDMRRAIRPVPRDLLVRLGPPPPGYRYVLIGDHVCLIDRGYQIHDVLHFELNF